MQENETLETTSTTEIPESPEPTSPIPIEAPVIQAQEQPLSNKELNFRELRLQKEKAERDALQFSRERDELLRRMSQSQQESDEDEPFSIGDSDLVEGKHISKINKQYEQRIKKLEAQFQQSAQQMHEATIETRLKVQYPDFNAVVTEDNIAMLRIQYPEIAQTINTSTDLYSKAVSAYTMIKKLGILVDDNILMDKHRIAQNQQKPKPMASINAQQGSSPLAKANAFDNGLTEELKAQLLKEMKEAIKNK